LVEESGVPGENHKPAPSYWQTWNLEKQGKIFIRKKVIFFYIYIFFFYI
jgi:hypothetical protein